ncbi:amino acid ABC transporter permease [Bradyrhizobium sp. SSBR45G]|uniref:amino acid ABC transporter permease n=1 Tax=unclassified Bradyrhizobium TaxID=2631580 RepID=UPI00234295E7|nr:MULTISPECIES: amino acid ABC transporter permease [unclassified Bradyrhizobium]GLH75586.1 amino acid ABC transporter permease [Bradyrhizobium sp. SSBR45G]GLH82624.1 amino acid ABC transporter permease [Bradyrhizobium sp. SSBR45R]
MTDITASNFIRQDMAGERPAPIKTTGLVGFVRTQLLNSPTNILLTLLSALLIWFTVIPALQFLLVDAVWVGKDREACLAQNAGHPVGACWPYISAKFGQFMYGFYPEAERWRVNLTYVLSVVLLVPLLIPRLPAKGLNAGIFFFALPVVAFFLLYGGGLAGFGVSWSASALSLFAESIETGGNALVRAGANVPVAGLLLWLLGKLVVLIGMLVSLVISPLAWLRDLLQASRQPVWTDLAVTAVAVTALVYVIGGGSRAMRSVIGTAATFVGIAVVIAVMGLDRGGLPIVDTRLWGGMLVTLVVSVIGIVASMPIGIALALGRRSTIPLIRYFSIAFIELVRGVPLITVLFFATYMLPLFLPGNMRIDGLVRALVGVALFSGAYMAEVIRGGLQAIPRGQAEAANALGLSWWKTTSFIVLPQALRHVIPGIVNSFISLFKDTSLVSIVALFDLLGSLKASFADPVWATPTTAFTGFAFTGMIYFAFCFGMSRYSLLVERRLNAHRRN